MIAKRLALLCCLVSLAAHAETNDDAVNVLWGYKGNISPEKWAELSPSFVICAKGKSQSPIDIPQKVTIVPDALKINYAKAPLTLVKDGQTKLDIANVETVIEDGHTIQVNFAPHTNETISFDNKTYRLVQLHIHTPSEHLWHGRSYPMEIHLVHQGDQGDVLVLAVLAKGGKANAELQKIVDHLPTEKGQEVTISAETINPAQLLPTNLDYYHFDGSLTIPICTEGVKWVVMANAITVSPPQIVILKRAIGGANARFVHPLNGRMIYYSKVSR